VPLDPKQKNAVLNWLSGRIPERGCPVCGKGPMQLGSELVSAPLLVVGPDGAHTFDLIRGATFVTLTCQECANTRFFSATRMGIAK
jgi:predicted nucleic-acid-binding Zn-ribbon protein